MTGFLLVCALVGATLIVVRGTIFRRLRLIYPPLLRCSQCTGFWVGAAAGLRQVVSLGQGRLLDAFLVGCATSILAFIVDGVMINLVGEFNKDE